MQTALYKIHLEPDEEDGGHIVTVPALPGCVTDGDTISEAISNAQECIHGHLRALAKAGQPIPPSDAKPEAVDMQVEVETVAG